jgi:hypothetical protein
MQKQHVRVDICKEVDWVNSKIINMSEMKKNYQVHAVIIHQKILKSLKREKMYLLLQPVK